MNIVEANAIAKRAQARAGLEPAKHRLPPNQGLNPRVAIKALNGRAYAFALYIPRENKSPSATSVSIDTPDLENELTNRLS